MKRSAVVLSFLLCLLLWAAPVALADDGVKEISTPDELAAIASDLNGRYKLTGDIVLTDDFTPLAAAEDSWFTGELDGGGYSIIGLRVNARDPDALFAGLFGQVSGSVHDLKLENVSVTLVAVRREALMAEASAGGIAARNLGVIERCFVSGSVTVTAQGDALHVMAGGIAGHNGGIIRDCGSRATVHAQNDPSGWIAVGGLAGHALSSSTVERCYNTGALAASGYIGGAVGWNYGQVNDCYYLNTAAAGVGRGVAGGTAFEAAGLMAQGTFPAFDFVNVWEMSGQGPTLQVFRTHLSNHTHLYDDGRITKPATCVAAGEKTYTCSLCGDQKTETIPATGKHTWDKGKVTVKPTTAKAGVMTYACTVCHTTKTEPIPKLNKPIVDSTKQFEDVAKGKWYVGAIDFAVENSLFEGMDSTHFAPDGNMTRAMYVTVLGRLAGAKVSSKTATKFSDVPTGQWYTGYVKWASDRGIVDGMDATHFDPNANVTREQICKMMIEYCSFAGIKLKSVNKATTFKDADRISGWARQYVSKAQTAGFVNGDNGYFDPKGNATRAQVATIFMNFDANYHVLS